MAKEGREKYFEVMSTPATVANDRARWGGDLNLDALATALGITIDYRTTGSPPRPLGCHSGCLTTPQPDENALLQDLRIGYHPADRVKSLWHHERPKRSYSRQ